LPLLSVYFFSIPMALAAPLTKLFQQAVAHTTPESVRAAGPLDPERRAFLEAALKEGTYDVIGRMRDHLAVLSKEGATTDELVEALEGLQFECEQYDFAQDLHRIGGFGVVVGLLDHPEPEVRMNAAWVLATCANQNPVVQQQSEEYGLLAKVLARLQTEQEAEVTQKLLLCVSALARGNPKMQRPFADLGGFEIVGALCEHPVLKIRRKAVFFLYTLLQQSTVDDVEKVVCQHGILLALRKALQICVDEFDEEVFQHSLNVLALLVPPTAGILEAAKACNFSETFDTVVTRAPAEAKASLSDFIITTKAFRE
jgi:hsp70-interacting protein